MEPVFLDFHIHTSRDPEKPDDDYDLDALVGGVELIAQGSPFLISLTDHNFVNKAVYLRAVEKIENLLLGVEIHIRNYAECRPYHCHILFGHVGINSTVIDEINAILDNLYPNKRVKNSEKIPSLEEVVQAFDEYEFLLLPHGGQNHSTFDRSIPKGVTFDRTLERSIYYNHFDGFTARGTAGLARTQEYFARLGINEFVNLVTATDNYTPSTYPNCNAGRQASEFVPTWMLALPTYDGLRLSLSESQRLMYGEKPDQWAEYIQSVSASSENLDIDVALTPGLNVVIGGSSSGKSLFGDTVHRKIEGSLDGSVYIDTAYEIESVRVVNPSGLRPHYFNQNYIMKICDQRDRNNTIDDISILKSVFPPDEVERKRIQNALSELGKTLTALTQAVEEIENLQSSVQRIPALSHLIVTDQIHDNPIRKLLPADSIIESISYSEADYERHLQVLSEIDEILESNPLIEHNRKLVEELEEELLDALNSSSLEYTVRSRIQVQREVLDDHQLQESKEVTSKRREFQQLRESITRYLRFHRQFHSALHEISTFSITIPTKPIKSMGHELSITNEFELTKEMFLDVINDGLTKDHRLESFDQLQPESLFKHKFMMRAPKLDSYEKFESYVKRRFSEMNKKAYKITTSDGRDFDSLSAGWKTSVILDLVLGWDADNAPLIIDQPEDNLATNYINTGLLTAIKKTKTKKQIILVSHNATIPMLGDAQNVILCENNENRITISSAPLEGRLGERSVVDAIADITDGGKSSIKKRVKKYDLKNYREVS